MPSRQPHSFNNTTTSPHHHSHHTTSKFKTDLCFISNGFALPITVSTFKSSLIIHLCYFSKAFALPITLNVFQTLLKQQFKRLQIIKVNFSTSNVFALPITVSTFKTSLKIHLCDFTKGSSLPITINAFQTLLKQHFKTLHIIKVSFRTLQITPSRQLQPHSFNTTSPHHHNHHSHSHTAHYHQPQHNTMTYIKSFHSI